MKLITSKGDSSSLKILIASEFSNTNVDLVFLEQQCSVSIRVPLLEVSSDPDDVIFTTNSGSYLLYPPPESIEKEVNNWLDWEAVHLKPAVVKCLDSKCAEMQPLISNITLLENGLKKSKYIVKNEISTADICVWSTIFPLFAEEKLTGVFASLKNIVDWFSDLEKLPQFQSAVEKLFPDSEMASLCSITSTSCSPARQTPQIATENPNKEPAIKESEIEEVKKNWADGVERRLQAKLPVVPSLPTSGERNILITSALPYVNNVPHLGNIIGCVLSADVFARYCRLRNWNTLYICGTDEYGTATETKALEEKVTPREICDKYFAIHRNVYSWFNIQFDLFGRTTTPEQTQIVQELFLACHKKGYTCTQFMDQLLCEKCDRFLADRFVEGVCPKCKYEDARGDQCDLCGQLINAVELIKPRCKVCGNTPVIKQSQQLFLDLPKVSEKLHKWVDETCTGWTQNSEVITKSWLKEGLKPRCITRDLKWGIPVPLPGFEKKVFYVWFDAPIGYMSITKCYTDQWKQWWQPRANTKVELFQFMAKDNVPFHAIMFPATLMAADAGYTIVNHVFATEYLNYEDGKFSKSRGVGVFGTDAQDTGISADVFRFYLLYMRPEGQDTCFSWVDLATKNNSELLNNLGNFVNRALMFCEKFYGSKIPEMVMTEEEWLFLVQVVREVRAYNQAMERSRFREGIIRILNISRLGNQYMQACQPWQAIKGSDKDKERAKTCVGVSCNMAGLLATILQPYMPKTAEIMAAQINAPKGLFFLTDNVYQILPPGHKIGKPSPLFVKLEQSTVDQLKKRFAGRQQSPPKTQQPDVKSATETEQKIEPDVKKQPTPVSVAAVEQDVSAQGEKVRKMKQEGKPKVEWQLEVDKLLELKKQLAKLKGEPDLTVKQELQ